MGRMVHRAALLALLASAAACARPPAAPGGASMPLIVSDRGGAVRIYEIDPAGGAARLVGSPGAGDASYRDTMPARLGDGRVLFVSDRGGRPALFVVSAQSDARPFAADPAAIDSDPAPLGERDVVFARAAEAAPRDLFAARSDGQGLRRLTRSQGDDGSPCSGDGGRTIVFASDRDGAPRLYRLDAAVGDPEATATLLSPPPAPGSPPSFADADPACLPDGSIVFSRSVQGAPPQLYRLSLAEASAGARPITDPAILPYGAGEPVALPGGGVLFTAGPGPLPAGATHGPRYAVYRIAEGGYNLARMTRERAGYNDVTKRLRIDR
jgi:hypothetical protein